MNGQEHIRKDFSGCRWRVVSRGGCSAWLWQGRGFFAALLVALGGCVSRPLAINQPLTEVMHHKRFDLQSKFIHEGTVYAVGSLYNSASNHIDILVFIADRLVCQTHPEVPGYDWRWVSQPDGLAYLAAMLRRASGKDGEMAPRELASATVLIPDVQQTTPESLADSSGQSVGQTVTGIAGATAVVGGSLILAPLAATFAVVGVSVGASTKGERGCIEPGMSRDVVVKTLGRPTVEFTLEGSGTEVLAYVPGDWSLNFAGTWYAGVKDGLVVWTHARHDWLDGLAKQQIKNAQRER